MSLLDYDFSAARTEPPSQFLTLTIVLSVLSALTLLWAGVDIRLIEGVPVWMKPFKFAFSFTVFFATIAAIETHLSEPVRNGRTLRIIGWIMAAAVLSEMAYMMYQAALSEASHFNYSTTFHSIMYAMMGVGATAIVAGTAVIGWVVKRDQNSDLSPVLREGIWLGFLLTFILTMIVAGYMSNTGTHVGIHPDGAATLPIFGWSGVTGDLRPAHFVSIHAMQVLPMLALWLSRQGKIRSVGTIRLASVGYAILTMAFFGQALLGLPLIALG